MTERNEKLRIRFEKTLEDNGVKLKFAAKKTNIADTTLSRWRHRTLEFSERHLNIVTEFCDMYQ